MLYLFNTNTSNCYCHHFTYIFFIYFAKNLQKSHLIKADSIHADSYGIPGEHLLGRHLVGHRTQVHTWVLRMRVSRLNSCCLANQWDSSI